MPCTSKDDISEKREDNFLDKGRSKLVVKNPEHQVKNIEDGHPDTMPIPPQNMRDGHQTQSCNNRLVRLSTSGDTKALSGTTCAVNYNDVKEFEQIKQEEAGGNSLLN